jgi:hypothetical protein
MIGNCEPSLEICETSLTVINFGLAARFYHLSSLISLRALRGQNDLKRQWAS